MSWLLHALIANALIAFPMTAVVLVARRSGASPAIVRALWILVLVKLVTPPVFDVPLPVSLESSIDRAESAPSIATPDVGEPSKASEIETVARSVEPAERTNEFESEETKPGSPSLTETDFQLVDAPTDRESLSEPEPPPIHFERSSHPEAGSVTLRDLDSPAPPRVTLLDITDWPETDLASAASSQPWSSPVIEDPVSLQEEAPSEDSPASTSSRVSWPSVLTSVWLAGLLLTGSLFVLRIRRFGRLVALAKSAPAPLEAEVAELSRRVGLARPPRTALLPAPISPLVWGWSKWLRLVLPEPLLTRLPSSERETLIVHELLHLRRLDHWVRLLELVVATIYWWHPVVWLARPRLRQAEEEACDAEVLRHLPGQRRRYATALVSTVEFLSDEPTPLPLAASGMGSAKNLSRRLTMILDAPSGHRPTWIGRGAVCLLALISLPFVPSLGESKDDEPSFGIEARMAALDAELMELAPELAALRAEAPVAPMDEEELLAALKAELVAANRSDQDQDELRARRAAIERELAELERARADLARHQLERELGDIQAQIEDIEKRLAETRHRERELQESAENELDESEMSEQEVRARMEKLSDKSARELMWHDWLQRRRARQDRLAAQESDLQARADELQQERRALQERMQDLELSMVEVDRERQQNEIERRQELLERDAESLRDREREVRDARERQLQLDAESAERQARITSLERQLESLHQRHARQSEGADRRLALEIEACEDQYRVKRSGLEQELAMTLESNERSWALEREELQMRMDQLAAIPEEGASEAERREAARELNELARELNLAQQRFENEVADTRNRLQTQIQSLEEEHQLILRNLHREHQTTREEEMHELAVQENDLRREIDDLWAREARLERRDDRRGDARADSAAALKQLIIQLENEEDPEAAAALRARLADLAAVIDRQGESLNRTDAGLRAHTDRLYEDHQRRLDNLESKVDTILQELSALRKHLEDRKLN
ncbi:MAG: M56 family metallopeptidase [Planctomycetota bacterium]